MSLSVCPETDAIEKCRKGNRLKVLQSGVSLRISQLH